MKKKKILFLLSRMNVGGVEKAFLGMLSLLPESQYEIHLALLKKDGGYLSYVPNYVHIHEVKCYDSNKGLINDPPLQVVKSLLGKRKIFEALIHLLLYVSFKVSHNRYWFYQYIMRKEPMMQGEYDMAVAYAGPSQMIDWYINKRVNARVKCGWIHFDISKFGIDRGMTRKLYRNYQKIFVVSETAKRVFDSVFPELSSKTEVFYNVVDVNQIKEMAEEYPGFDDDYKGMRLLTVGRISVEKGQDVAIRALKMIIDKGVEARYYLVGDGLFKETCVQLAESLGIADRVVFLGTQVNPYPYMKNCDVYIQPSRHEGYCITLAEARVFPSPIVATCFTGAKEQLASRTNARVVGMTANEIAEGLMEVSSMPLLSDDCQISNTEIQTFSSLIKNYE